VCSCQENAAADPSCGKNICCSSTTPGASWKRDSGQDIAPKSPPLKIEVESAPELFDEIVQMPCAVVRTASKAMSVGSEEAAEERIVIMALKMRRAPDQFLTTVENLGALS